MSFGTESQAQTLVVAAVISRGDSVLLCRRPTHKHHGGMWEFPGGKVQIGETLAAAVERELEEELGVRTIEVGASIYSAVDSTIEIEISFLPTVIVGTPQPLEHSELEWVEQRFLQNYDLAPIDRQFAAFLNGRTR